MYPNMPQHPGGGQQALRARMGPEQGRTEMGRYTGPDALPAGERRDDGGGMDNIRALLTQPPMQPGTYPAAPPSPGGPVMPQGGPPPQGIDRIRQQFQQQLSSMGGPPPQNMAPPPGPPREIGPPSGMPPGPPQMMPPPNGGMDTLRQQMMPPAQ